MKPREALLKAGAAVEIVSLAKKPIKGWRKKKWGDEIEVDLDINAASPSRYDGLMLPGGTLNADTLCTEPRAITFIKDLSSEEHASELQSIISISYAVFCLKQKTQTKTQKHQNA